MSNFIKSCYIYVSIKKKLLLLWVEFVFCSSLAEDKNDCNQKKLYNIKKHGSANNFLFKTRNYNPKYTMHNKCWTNTEPFVPLDRSDI